MPDWVWDRYTIRTTVIKGCSIWGTPWWLPNSAATKAVNKTSGEILWQVEMPGIVTSISHTDGKLFCQLGKMIVSSKLDKGKIKTDARGVKPYGFAAVDAESGNLLWSTTDFKVDPTLALAATIDEGVLYGCDGKTLYALPLDDGSYKWKFDIQKRAKRARLPVTKPGR